MSSTNREQTSPCGKDDGLFLLLELGETTYAIDAGKVKEVVPPVMLETASETGDAAAGYFDYRGQVVPVLDLCRLLTGRPCRMRLSTRIILTEHSGVRGLMAEGVTDIIRKEREAFAASGTGTDKRPYLGGILMENGKIIRYLDTDLIAGNTDFRASDPK